MHLASLIDEIKIATINARQAGQHETTIEESMFTKLHFMDSFIFFVLFFLRWTQNSLLGGK